VIDRKCAVACPTGVEDEAEKKETPA